MRRLAALLSTAALTLGALGAVAAVGPAAGAATAPTITGPRAAGYYANVALTGTTPSPGEAVDVYFAPASSGPFTVGRHLTSDPSGHFGTSYHATRTAYYYARVGGVNSAVHVTRLLGARCTVSGPAFRKLPVQNPIADNDFPDFAAFTATRRGLWAGVAVSVRNTQFAVIRWRAGHRVQVVHTFSYHRASFESATPASVEVSAVTPHGYLVVTVQDRRHNLEDDRFVGYVWRGGRLHRVATDPSWRSVHLIGASAAGTIVGWARTGTTRHPRYVVVRWSETGLHYRTVTRLSSDDPHPVVDGAGDISYYQNLRYWVRVERTGQVRELQALDHGPNGGGNGWPQAGGSGAAIYGTSDTQLARWDIRAGTGPIAPAQLSGGSLGRNFHYVARVGPHGEIVDGYFGSGRLRQHLLLRPFGAYVAIPRQADVDPAVSGRPGEVMDTHGRLAFTSAQDHLVHFLRCR